VRGAHLPKVDTESGEETGPKLTKTHRNSAKLGSSNALGAEARLENKGLKHIRRDFISRQRRKTPARLDHCIRTQREWRTEDADEL